jgi:hypothetical protein
VDAAASSANGIAGQTSVCERTAGATDERHCCVRQNRVVLAPVAGVKSAEVFLGPTGPDKAFNPLTTVTRRIRRRGEHGISRKTIAQGRRNAPTVPVCSCALAIVFCTRDRGCSKHPAFPAPSSLGAKRFARPGRKVSRECGGVFCRHCERRRTPPPFEASAALRHLRVTATRERHPCARVTRERHPEVRASCEPRRMARAASAS